MGNDDEEDGDGDGEGYDEGYDDGASPTTNNDDDVLGVDVDDNSDLAKESAGSRSRPRARSTPAFRDERERRVRDELKMPVGQADGWAPL